MKPRAIYTSTGGAGALEAVYDPRTRAVLEGLADFGRPLYAVEELSRDPGEWKETEYFFTTWGAPALDEGQLAEHFPRLKAVFYAAGSVQYFVRPFLKRGVRVFSANEALSEPVIEFTAAQIFLANKGYFGSLRLYREDSWKAAKDYTSCFPGNEGASAGIAGAGRIGRGVIEKLKAGRLGINVFDPFLPGEAAEKMGVRKAETLEELFSSSFVISNHLANNEQTKGLMKYRHFALMKDHGVFINTGRGAQVEEEGLARALREKPTRTALLDVSWPEPVERDHPFLGMPNVLMSPHIAGPINNERIWLGEYIAKEFSRLLSGASLGSEVTEDMLLTSA